MRSVKEPVSYKSLSIPEPLFNEFKQHVQSSPNYRNMAEFLRASIREKMNKDIEIRDMEMKGKGTFYDYELDEQMIFKYGKWMRVTPNPKKKKNKNIDKTDKERDPIEVKLDKILTLLVNGKDKKVEKNGFRG